MIKLRIGKYNFSILEKNSIWMSRDDEGMQVSIYEIEKILDKYWQENF